MMQKKEERSQKREIFGDNDAKEKRERSQKKRNIW